MRDELQRVVDRIQEKHKWHYQQISIACGFAWNHLSLVLAGRPGRSVGPILYAAALVEAVLDGDAVPPPTVLKTIARGREYRRPKHRVA